MGRPSLALIPRLLLLFATAAGGGCAASWWPDLEPRPPTTLAIERPAEDAGLAFLRLPDGHLVAAGWGEGAARAIAKGLLDRGEVEAAAVALLDGGGSGEVEVPTDHLLAPGALEHCESDGLRLVLVRGPEGASLRLVAEGLVVVVGPPAAVAERAADADVAALLDPGGPRPRVCAIERCDEPADPALEGPRFRLAPGERIVLELERGRVRRIAKRDLAAR